MTQHRTVTPIVLYRPVHSSTIIACLTDKVFALVDWEGKSSVLVVPYSMISGKVGKDGEMCWVKIGFKGKIIATTTPLCSSRQPYMSAHSAYT